MQKLFGTTAINMSSSLVKDIAFAKMFGKQVEKVASASVGRVPKSTYVIFLTRDTLTIAGGFTVPTIVSEQLQAWMSSGKADKLAQLISPMGM